MDNSSLSLSTVALWDKQAVNEFLKKNKIYGCSTVIDEKGLDGIGFLNLDLATVKTLGLTLIERCKINALLNSLASEADRKAFTSKWSESAVIFNSNLQSENRMPLPINGKKILPPVPIKPPHLSQLSGEKLFPIVPSRSATLSAKPIQPNNVATFPENKPDTKKREITGGSFEHDEQMYEVLMPSVVTPQTLADWENCDIFSSDEFSDSDEATSKPNKRDVQTETRKTSNCDELLPQKSSTSLFTSCFTTVTLRTKGSVYMKRQPDPTSTPPPLPIRNREKFGGSTSSINSDRSDSTVPVRKVPLPAPTIPPPPPPNRSLSTQGNKHQSLSPVTSPLCRSPREVSPARNREDDQITSNPWYYSVGRRDAERSLRQCVEGAFLVRPTEHGGQNHRFTMSIIFNRRIFHIPVRQKSDGRWALGSEKEDEETYESVESLVEDHRMKPINLHTDGRLVGTTCLVIWPSRQTF